MSTEAQLSVNKNAHLRAIFMVIASGRFSVQENKPPPEVLTGYLSAKYLKGTQVRSAVKSTWAALPRQTHPSAAQHTSPAPLLCGPHQCSQALEGAHCCHTKHPHSVQPGRTMTSYLKEIHYPDKPRGCWASVWESLE